MKFRNLLMTTAILMAVTSAFAFKAKSKGFYYFSYISGGTCYVGNGNTDQQYCEDFFTGAQCTYQTTPIYDYDPIGFPPPTCSVPLRRFN